ncbi:MAG: hypothetical protein HY673_16725 [Chloroflexi bacterium]|nr:hypothetical protein [Chloroflexota bacterium]
MVIDSPVATCRAVRKKDGTPCAGIPMPSGYCLAHDPGLKDKRREAARRGGQNKAKAVRLRRLIPPRLAPIFDRLEEVLDELHARKLDPRIGSSMATVAAAMCRLLAVGELEERVRSLEESSKNRKG